MIPLMFRVPALVHASLIRKFRRGLSKKLEILTEGKKQMKTSYRIVRVEKTARKVVLATTMTVSKQRQPHHLLLVLLAPPY